MSTATVKAALTRKRAKKVVENAEYGAFARRILRGYARRVADGDIEALSSMVLFMSDVDSAVAEAVAGLRRFGYSWGEIASRLGVSRQAVQMRYGQASDRDRLDARLLAEGVAVSVATLVAVFADHHPGKPTPSTCPGCGYRYPDGEGHCPTLATVRPVLYGRRHEDPRSLSRLTQDQYTDLHDRNVLRALRVAARRAGRPGVCLDEDTLSLFTLPGGAP